VTRMNSVGPRQRMIEKYSETARRIWEWWVLHADKLHSFTKAAELVVLHATSSCSVERLFSQLKLIIEATCGNSLQDNIELRAMVRVNKARR
jgi:hypothetical protein